MLHGTEPATERPLFRADSVKVGLKIISMMKRDVDISSLVVDVPQVNILVDASGKTNFPAPKVKGRASKDPMEGLVDLAVGSINLNNGSLSYADRKIPLSVHGENLHARLNYHFADPSYHGDLAIKHLNLETGKTRPMMLISTQRSGSTGTEFRLTQPNS